MLNLRRVVVSAAPDGVAAALTTPTAAMIDAVIERGAIVGTIRVSIRPAPGGNHAIEVRADTPSDLVRR